MTTPIEVWTAQPRSLSRVETFDNAIVTHALKGEHKVVLADDLDALILRIQHDDVVNWRSTDLSKTSVHDDLCACYMDGEALCNRYCLYCSCTRIERAEKRALRAAIAAVDACRIEGTVIRQEALDAVKWALLVLLGERSES